MFKDTDTINVYNDYDYKIYMGSANQLDSDYVLLPKVDGEPYLVSVLWRDIVKANQKSILIKQQAIRFEEDKEEEAYKQLRINLEREKDSYSKKQIEDMILNPSDEVLNTIVSVNKLSTIETFLSQLVILKNTNKYFIAEKVELYIRARKEEIISGIRKSELEVTPTENIEMAIVEETIEEVDKIEEVEVKKTPTTPKKTTPRKTTVTK